MRRDRKDLLSELNRNRGRNLAAEEFEAVANLTLRRGVRERQAGPQLRGRFKVFDGACRRARRKATQRHEGLKGETVTDIHEERVFWNDTFHAELFDFRGQVHFARFDGCTFVKCTIVLDSSAEQLAFTGCTFKDCNIDHIDADEGRGIVVRDNFFDRPIAERKADFERRFAEALNRRLKS
ncbi:MULTISPECIES: hypothetical protein [unclassified Bradyrhizobium]